MKTFVIADTHFGHGNIIKYCNRPFCSAEEMDEVIIKNWNETVSKRDTVIHLGDFGLCKKDRLQEIIGNLNGKKILIMGNHDIYPEQFYRDAGFAVVSKYPILYEGFWLMSHEPLILSETTPYFNCYGHVHNDSRYIDNATSRCCCVERTGYRPTLLIES